MKKSISLLLSIILLLSLLSEPSLADDGGEIGIFGGISEGRNLPFTMENTVESGLKVDNNFFYKEMVFLTGVPIECTGSIIVDKKAVDYIKSPTGKYDEKYTIKATNEVSKVTLERSITFSTSYRVIESEFKKQIIRNSVVTKWTEEIVIGDNVYTLSLNGSSFSKSSVEDLTPGVSYYDTVISSHSKYVDEDGKTIDLLLDGDIYGFQQFWSKVEKQNLLVQISNDGVNYDTVIEMKPFLEAKKTMYYDETVPFPISFGGTFNQRLERQTSLSYDIVASKIALTEAQKHGEININPANEIEKLPIPSGIDFIEGHWAELDLKKVYSMEIFTETPREGMQFEAITRGEYIKALCFAMNIDTSKYDKTTSKSPQVFADVPKDHPLYKYIMSAYDVKLIKGTGEDFSVASPLTRQEAFVILIRIIGLERLGVTASPQTPFLDDAQIASWAKKEVMAGYKLGLLKGNESGNVKPKEWISKVEAATVINRMIDFLREEIAEYYKR